MLRSAIRKMMWLGRATSAVVGLAILLAVAIGAANSALAHTNVDNMLFHLNHNNPVTTTLTKLTGTLAGPVLRLDNNSTATGATALNLQVEPGKAPMSVNASAGTATGLSADELDGKTSSAFWSGQTYQITVAATNINDKSEGTAICNSGDVALGGGYQLQDADSKVVHTRLDSDSYSVGWVTVSEGLDELGVVYVHCADFAPLHHDIQPLKLARERPTSACTVKDISRASGPGFLAAPALPCLLLLL